MNFDVWTFVTERPFLLILIGLAIIIVYILLRLYQFLRWRDGPRWFYSILFKEYDKSKD